MFGYWLTSNLVFIGYIVLCIALLGVTRSISITYSELPKDIKRLYSFAMFGTAIPLAMAGGTPIMYVAGSMIVLTGLAADVRRNKWTQRIHVYSANIGMGLGLLSLWIDFGLWYYSAISIIILGFIYLGPVRNKTYWAEIVIYFIVSIGVLEILDVWN